MTLNNDYEDVVVDRVVHSTAKALLCRIDGMEFWIPKSQIYRVDDYHRGYSGMMEIAVWWLEANDLEHLTNARPEQWELPNELEAAHQIYRRLATKYHPDRSPQTEEFMKDLNELWQAVLSVRRGR